jgi:hypothetical protein
MKLSDNYFDLVANESKVVKLNNGKISELKKHVKVITLFDSYYVE